MCGFCDFISRLFSATTPLPPVVVEEKGIQKLPREIVGIVLSFALSNKHELTTYSLISKAWLASLQIPKFKFIANNLGALAYRYRGMGVNSLGVLNADIDLSNYLHCVSQCKRGAIQELGESNRYSGINSDIIDVNEILSDYLVFRLSVDYGLTAQELKLFYRSLIKLRYPAKVVYNDDGTVLRHVPRGLLRPYTRFLKIVAINPLARLTSDAK